MEGKRADLRNYSRKGLKKAVQRAAEKEWKARVTTNSRLCDTYSQVHTLKRRGYLGVDFPGRQVLLKLRVDDLALGASRWMTSKQILPACDLVRRGPETRQHFVLDCGALQDIRDRHGEVLSLCVHPFPDRETAFKALILAHPANAVDDVARAKLVGALLLDLWKERCQRLNVRFDLW